MPKQDLNMRHALATASAALILAIAYMGVSASSAWARYDLTGQGNSTGGSKKAEIDRIAPKTPATKPRRPTQSADGTNLYDLFDRYNKLMSEGKKAEALPVITKAWSMAGCGKYEPKADCLVLRSAGKKPGPSPMQIVQQVIASVGYNSPQVGAAPNHSINHLTTRDGRALDSVVGYPNWFWAIGGTQADKQVTKSAYGMKVSLSIHPDSLTVAPGDGTSFTCTGMGTEWTPQVPPQTPSPSCGYTYSKTGTYTVRMTAKWTVHYVITGPGVNVAGDVPVQGWHQRTLVIGELQTVVDH